MAVWGCARRNRGSGSPPWVHMLGAGGGNLRGAFGFLAKEINLGTVGLTLAKGMARSRPQASALGVW